MDKDKTEIKKGDLDDAFTSNTMNFINNGKFFICGDIDDTLPEQIIAPFIREVELKSKLKNPSPIEIHITSNGGSVNFAFDLITQIEKAKRLGVPVHTYVTSCVCSAGSLIACVGHKRFVSKRAYHLLHFARGWEYSHNPVMSQRNAENWKWMQKELVDIYKQYTKIKNIEDKLLADNYMVNGGKELIRLGLADELV